MTGVANKTSAIMARDLKLAFRAGGGWFYALFFFVLFVSLSAIAIGPELSALKAAAPAVIWLAIAIAIQIASTNAFEVDYHDGSLRAFAAEQSSLMPYWLGKAGALVVSVAAPLIIAAPFVLVLLGVPLAMGLAGTVLLALGSPALILVSLLTAAMATGLRAGGLLAMIIALPFFAPVLVFGVNATKIYFESGNMLPPEALILGALSLFMAALIPGFTLAALRFSLE